MDSILSKVLLDFVHDGHASIKAPELKCCSNGVVAIRALDSGHDMLCQDLNYLLDLLLIGNQHNCLVDKADSELVQHEMRELRKHFVDDHCQDFSPHDPNDGEQHIVTLVVECEALDISLD